MALNVPLLFGKGEVTDVGMGKPLPSRYNWRVAI